MQQMRMWRCRVIGVATPKEEVRMRQPRTWWCRGMLALGILCCALVAPAMAQVFVYDDFSEGLIDPSRWSPGVISGGNIYDMGRLVLGGELVEYMAVRGGVGDGGVAFGRHELRFNRRDFTALVFDATVLHYEVTGCPTPGSESSRVFVDAPLTLFNDGTRAEVNDQTGDIQARIEIFRGSDSTAPPEMMQSIGQLTRCADPACTAREFIGVVDLGPVVLGQRNTYGFSWDGFSRIISFWRSGGIGDVPPTPIFYPQNVAFRLNYRAIGLSASAANCSAGPRPTALVLAAIDNVVMFVP